MTALVITKSWNNSKLISLSFNPVSSLISHSPTLSCFGSPGLLGSWIFQINIKTSTTLERPDLRTSSYGKTVSLNSRARTLCRHWSWDEHQILFSIAEGPGPLLVIWRMVRGLWLRVGKDEPLERLSWSFLLFSPYTRRYNLRINNIIIILTVLRLSLSLSLEWFLLWRWSLELEPELRGLDPVFLCLKWTSMSLE